MFRCDKFNFDWEERMTSLEAIKEEAFKNILRYNGILEHRRASVIEGLIAEDNQLKRRPSAFADNVQKDLQDLMGKMVQNPEKQVEQVPNDESLLGKVKKFFGKK
jgi:hypothetical protein